MSAGRAGVRSVPVPPDLRAAAGLSRPDFADAFAAPLPPGAPDDVAAWHQALLRSSAPAWLHALMRARGVLARLLRLHTADLAGAGPFQVVSRTADLVVAGADDRHLDFRVVLQVVTAAHGGRELLVVTVVQRHNAVGRAYFALVSPFHRRVVPALLRRALRSAALPVGHG